MYVFALTRMHYTYDNENINQKYAIKNSIKH